ncbi:MAG: anti-sigma factor family protein [Candidatus Binatia bacterium]
MNCEECSHLISVFMDNELSNEKAVEVRTHLAICNDCARMCEDLAMILDACQGDEAADLMPPNSQALWCRINNLIESEIKQEPPPEIEKPKRGIWQLSFAQLASGFIAIAVISSLLTVIGIKNYNQRAAEDFTTRSPNGQTTFEKFAGKIGLIETPQQARERRVKQQQAAIEYWNNRVQVRRVQWDKTMRDAFDRNLNEIDQTVNEYTLILQKDPQDDLSGEMLDSALTEKMNLLREFSDL